MDATVDTGLGTAYERVAVYGLLERWLAPLGIETAFEGPIDNMAGVPGVHLIGAARLGARVTVALGEPRWLDNARAIYARAGVGDRVETRLVDPRASLPDRAWDLALTYNALPIVADWRELLRRVARASRRYLVVALTNPASYGVFIRKAIRVVEPSRGAELFDHESTRPRVVERELERLGTIEQHAYFDCPWWPDLFVDAGESLVGATLRRFPIVGARLAGSGAGKRLSPERFVYGADRFPFQGDDTDAELDRALRRHPVFDERPEPIARVFGHLHAYLVALR
jgi:hypothetical protein